MGYHAIEPGAANDGRSISFYRLAYRNSHQVMVRLPRATLERAGWRVGDLVNVEFDSHKGRLRLTRSINGSFKIGGKSKSRPGDQTEGRLRWAARIGRPDIAERFATDDWSYRKTDDAVIINTKTQMEIAT